MLAGVTAAFLSKEVDPFTAVCAAVSTHLTAGVIAAEEIGSEGVIASDVIAALPPAQIEPLFDLGYHYKHVDTIFARVFGYK